MRLASELAVDQCLIHIQNYGDLASFAGALRVQKTSWDLGIIGRAELDDNLLGQDVSPRPVFRARSRMKD